MTTNNLTTSRQGMKFGARRKVLNALVLLLCSYGPVLALPTSPTVVSGNATFTTNGSTMTITNSANAIINWNNFSINNGELTRFLQPSTASAVLNRVVGSDPSRIFGTLQSNGKVLLVNQNGILFGPTAKIDVNGLVASTLNISNEDFLAGRMKFSMGALAGPVENQGEISTPGGGHVYLIAPDVTNSGIIKAPNGDILLAAGKEVLLVDKSAPEIAVVVSAPEDQAVNIGQLLADAGRIGVYGGVVRQRGVISANSAVQDASGRIFFKASKEVTVEAGSLTTANGPAGGNITLQATEGTTLVSGTVEARGNELPGGAVHLLGQYVGLIDQGSVDVSSTTGGGGTVLVGGDYKGANPVVQNALASYLGPDATIKADALDSGNGGTVILWSEEATRSYGTISVRGGANGGNGGFVETSSRQYLDVQKAPDTGALKGKAGLWLLDPEDITIGISASTNITSGPIFSPASPFTTTYLNVSLLANYLQSTGDAIVNTASTGSGGGTITLADALNVTLPASRTLTLTANANINIQNDIIATGNPLNLTLHAGAGSISLAPIVTGTVDVNLNGGSFVADAATGISVGGAYNANLTAGNIFFHNLTSGNITVNAASTTQSTGGPLNLMNEASGGKLVLSGLLNANSNVFYGRAAGIDLNGPTVKGAFIRMEATGPALGVVFNGGAVGDSASTQEIEFNSDLLTVSGGGTTIQTSNASIQYEVNYAPYSGANISLSTYLPTSLIANTYTPTLLIGHENGTGGSTVTGNITVGSLTWSNGQRLALLSGGSVTGGGITAQGLGVIAGGQINLTGNLVDKIALQSAGGGVSFGNAKSFYVVSEVGGLVDPTIINGVTSNGANILLSASAGDIWLAAPVNAGGGAVSLTASAGGIYTAAPGAINVYAGSFSANAGTNIGGPEYALITQTPYWSSLYTGGSMFVDNIGALETTGSVDAGGMVSLSTHSPLTIGTSGVYAVGDIKLLAAPMGGLDDLTINGPVVSSAGNVYLAAGNAIYENAAVSAAGAIARTPYLNGGLLPPSLQPAPPPPPLYSDPGSSIGTATLDETTADLLIAAESTPDLVPVAEDAALATTQEENGAGVDDKDKRKGQAEEKQQRGDKRDAKPKKKNYCN